MRIVYDASAKLNCSMPSLNECLETGPSLHNLLWSVLVREIFFPVALCGDKPSCKCTLKKKTEMR